MGLKAFTLSGLYHRKAYLWAYAPITCGVIKMSIGGVLHNEIKRQARQMLIERGFQDNEIYDEYRVKINEKSYVIDVVGVCNNKCVAVECGMLSGKNRIPVLETHFDEVYHLPYLDSTLVGKIEGYKTEIRSNSNTIYRLELEVASLKQLIKIEPIRTKSKMQPKNDVKIMTSPPIAHKREDKNTSISPHIRDLIKNQNERLDKAEKQVNKLLLHNKDNENYSKSIESPEEKLLREIREYTSKFKLGFEKFHAKKITRAELINSLK